MERISFVKQTRDCCGCAACIDACPVHCITLEQGKDSFFYPFVNEKKCINCHRCERVCPIINAESVKSHVINNTATAMVSRDSVLLEKSSSGGVFSLIVEAFVHLCAGDKYAIFGVAFDGTKAITTYRADKSECDIFMKSKYVQSCTLNVFEQIKIFLDEGYWVLFTGTPCQCAAVRCFLGTKHSALSRLVVVDLICHGAPSQKMLDDYLNELSVRYGKRVEKIGFRKKIKFNTHDSNSRNIVVKFEDGEKTFSVIDSEYLRGFHSALTYRDSCYHCRFSTPSRVGDLTIGDCWDIQRYVQEWNPHNGTSFVKANTEVGEKLLKYIKEEGSTSYIHIPYLSRTGNRQLFMPAPVHIGRKRFMRSYMGGKGFCESVLLGMHKNFWEKCYSSFKARILYRIKLFLLIRYYKQQVESESDDI